MWHLFEAGRRQGGGEFLATIVCLIARCVVLGSHCDSDEWSQIN